MTFPTATVRLMIVFGKNIAFLRSQCAALPQKNMDTANLFGKCIWEIYCEETADSPECDTLFIISTNNSFCSINWMRRILFALARKCNEKTLCHFPFTQKLNFITAITNGNGKVVLFAHLWNDYIRISPIELHAHTHSCHYVNI